MFEPGSRALVQGLTNSPQYNWESCVILGPEGDNGRIGVQIIGGCWNGKKLSLLETCLASVEAGVSTVLRGRLAAEFGNPVLRQALRKISGETTQLVLEAHIGQMLPIRSTLVFFGCNRGPHSTRTSNVVMAFSQKGQCWIPLGDVPFRTDIVAAAKSSETEATFIGDRGIVKKFNAITRTWSLCLPMLVKRRGCACTPVPGGIFVAWGADSAQEQAKSQTASARWEAMGITLELDEACSPEMIDSKTGAWSYKTFDRNERVTEFCERQNLSRIECASMGYMEIEGSDCVILAGGSLAGTTDATHNSFSWQMSRCKSEPQDPFECSDPSTRVIRVTDPSMPIPSELLQGSPTCVRLVLPDASWQFDTFDARVRANFPSSVRVTEVVYESPPAETSDLDGILPDALPDMIVPRSQAASCMWHGMMIMAGGFGGRPRMALDSVEAFDGSQWVPWPDMKISRVGGALVVVNGSLFAIGGNLGSCAVERFNEDAGSWDEMASMKLSKPLGACVAFGLPCKDQGTRVFVGASLAVGAAATSVRVPKQLVVKGDTFTYVGEYSLEAETMGGRPVWKWTQGPRYIHYDSTSSCWRLGSFGTSNCSEQRCFYPRHSQSGWDKGFDFHACSDHISPHLVPPSQWEMWGPEGFFSSPGCPWGWYPTSQVSIVSADAADVPTELVVYAERYGGADNDSDDDFLDFTEPGDEPLVDGLYKLQDRKHEEHHFWKQDDVNLAEVEEEIQAIQKRCNDANIRVPAWAERMRTKKAFYIYFDQDAGGWFIGHCLGVKAKAAWRCIHDSQSPDLIPQGWWEFVGPGHLVNTRTGKRVLMWKHGGLCRIVGSDSIESENLPAYLQSQGESHQDLDSDSDSSTEPVVQTIHHEEPPATLQFSGSVGLAEDARQHLAEEHWAAGVEKLIRLEGAADCSRSPDQAQNEAPAEKVHLLRFGSGDGQLLHEALLEGPQFRPCREALTNAGFSCIHVSQAKILVRPDQFEDVCEDLKSHEVHAFHIVITESLEYLLNEVLHGMPCRRRPREKMNSRYELLKAAEDSEEAEDSRGHNKAHKDSASVAGDNDEESDIMFDVQRTFICVAPQYKDPRTVVQSTTEAVRSAASTSQGSNEPASINYYQHFRGINPRRVT